MKKYIALTLIVITLLGVGTGCAWWDRTKKDWESSTKGGLHRTIEVYSINGEKIHEFEGKFDISYDDERLQFVDENNKKHNIYHGDNNTIIVREK